jgi:hypothetical protein
MTLLGAWGVAASPSLSCPNGGAWHFCEMGEQRQIGMVLTHELLPCSPSADLFGRSRRRGVRIRFRGNSRYVICHATLFDIRIFRHTVFHHCFSISSPFIGAIFGSFLRVLSVCLSGAEMSAGAVEFGLVVSANAVKCGTIIPANRANRTEIRFHLSTPVGIAFIAKGFF